MTEKAAAGDPFILDHVYTDPVATFFFRPKPLEEIHANCLVFLDTSTLMVPYDIGAGSLNSLTEVYRKLVAQNRLFIPRRVMQEYENLAPIRLTEIYHRIAGSIKETTISFSPLVPMLGELDEYKSANEARNRAEIAIEEYKAKIRETLAKIEDWRHDDIVRRTYQEIFSENQLVSEIDPTKDLVKERNRLLDAWKYRLTNKVPPGYLDGGKRDSGIGDYLIWAAILRHGKLSNADAIFVTQDVSEDVLHGKLYARREMLEEYRAATNGRTIHLIRPERFAEIFGAQAAAEELQITESNNHTPLATIGPSFDAFQRWAENRYRGNLRGVTMGDGYFEIRRDAETDNAVDYYAFPMNDRGSLVNSFKSIVAQHDLRMATRPVGVNVSSRIFFFVPHAEISNTQAYIVKFLYQPENAVIRSISVDEFFHL